MKNKISVSMMCANFMDLKSDVKTLEDNGIEYFHLDIMDGHFVPNFTLGSDFCKILKANSSIPLDIHFMVENPENCLDWVTFGEGDYVSIHAESTYHIQRTLRKIKDRGAKAMLALNPATPISYLDYCIDDIDGVLIMTVNPGFAGQKLIPQTLDKITEVRKYLDARNKDIEIEVDGNVSFENAKKMKKAGANIFVAGTSSVFSKADTMANNISKLREAIKD